MNRNSGFRTIVTSNWFMASIPALVIFLFLPSLGSRFKVTAERDGKYTEPTIYSDMNSDGISEMIYSGKGSPYYYVDVKDKDFHIFDQWNIKGDINPYISEIYTGNYDKDAYQEIYIFTHTGDSLFLNVNEMLQHSGLRLEHVFIAKIGFIDNQLASMLKPVGLYDQNGDGKDEFYFSITSSYTREPRKIYFYDIVNRRLQSSGYSASICLFPEMKDIDGDMRPEIFGLSSASGNYPTNAPYSDSSSWFMVFNDQLKFEFPPVEFRGFANGLEVRGFNKGEFRGYILSHISSGTDTTVMKPQIILYTADGKYVRNRLYKSFSTSDNFNVYIDNKSSSLKIIVAADKLFQLNEYFDVVKTVNIPYRTGYAFYRADINGDGDDELLLYFHEEDELDIYSQGLQLMGKTRFNPDSSIWRLSEVKNKDQISKLYIGAGKTGYFLEMRENKFYFFTYMFFPATYFLFYFFILLIRRITTFQVVQKESLKRRLVTLQIQGIKSQLDPHFTFNTLNSVASLIYLDDRQAAYDYMNKFTRMLRVMLNDAERLYRSLGEEIDFVTTYLELEKLRFGDKFEFQIETGEGVSQKELIPKLVLQTFAENAIKHGLMPCNDGGLLRIRADLEKDFLKLTIEDNGIGREKARGLSTSTGKGLRLTSEFYDILNQINRSPIRYFIEDLYSENGKASGTRVTVMVPLDITPKL